jgi:TRAP-type C4-dicarboxylate transport system substrate-binding protein
MFSTRPIRTPEDLRAAHPWRWPDDIILPAVYQEIGATGVALQVPEVLGALQTNRVDTVFASPLAAIALQWSAHVRYRSEQPTSGSVGGVVLSRAVFQSLSADEQRTMREVTQQFGVLLARNLLRDEMAALAVLTQRGVQAVTLDDAQRARWLGIFGRVRARLVGAIADAQWIERVRNAGRATP